VRGQILRGESIPTLIVTFSRVMRVSIGVDVFSALFIEQSTMVSDLVVVMVVILEDEDMDYWRWTGLV